MEKMTVWLYVIVALAIALLGNYVSALWASKDNKFSLLLLAVLIVSPFVFITFGLVTSKLGVAVGAGTLDALLTASTIVMGLLVFQEWNRLSLYQYLGLVLVVAGIVFIQFSVEPKV